MKKFMIPLLLLFIFSTCLGGCSCAKKEVYNEEPLIAADEAPFISVALDKCDFTVGDDGSAFMLVTVRLREEYEGEIALIDETGKTLTTIEANGELIYKAHVMINRKEARTGSIYAKTENTESRPVSYYVTPEITREMVDRLDAVCDDMYAYITAQNFSDPYSDEALSCFMEWLENDERVLDYEENAGGILFHTVDGLTGGYGYDRTSEFGAGFSDIEDVFDEYENGGDISQEIIFSEIPQTNDCAVMLTPITDDRVMREFADTSDYYIRTLYPNLYPRRSFAKDNTALMRLGRGDFTDAGLFILNSHGSQMFISGEEHTTANIISCFQLGPDVPETLTALGDPEAKDYFLLFSEIGSNVRVFQQVGIEDNYMATSWFLESVLADKQFDNTIVYLNVCYAMSDFRLRSMLIEHGASVVIGSRGVLGTKYSEVMMYHLFKTLSTEVNKLTYGNLLEGLDTLTVDAANALARVDGYKDIVKPDEINDATFRQHYMRNSYNNVDEDAPLPDKLNSSIMLPRDYHYANGRTIRRNILSIGNIDGYVKTKSGNAQDAAPIGNANVTAYRFHNHDFIEEATTQTDSEGHYAFEKLPYGNYIIKAEKDGESAYISTTVDEENYTAENIYMLLLIEGLVLDSKTNEPIEGANVVLMQDDAVYEAITDASGRFKMTVQRKDSEVKASAEKYSDKTVSVRKEKLENIVILLEENNAGIFYQYLREIVIPEEGLANISIHERRFDDPATMASIEKFNEKNAGLISAVVCDLDGDEEQEMLTLHYKAMNRDDTNLEKVVQSISSFKSSSRYTYSSLALEARVYALVDGKVTLTDTRGNIICLESDNWGDFYASLYEHDGRIYLYTQNSQCDLTVQYEGHWEEEYYHFEEDKFVFDYIYAKGKWRAPNPEGFDCNELLGALGTPESELGNGGMNFQMLQNFEPVFPQNSSILTHVHCEYMTYRYAEMRNRDFTFLMSVLDGEIEPYVYRPVSG